MSELYNFAE